MSTPQADMHSSATLTSTRDYEIRVSSLTAGFFPVLLTIIIKRITYRWHMLLGGTVKDRRGRERAGRGAGGFTHRGPWASASFLSVGNKK